MHSFYRLQSSISSEICSRAESGISNAEAGKRQMTQWKAGAISYVCNKDEVLNSRSFADK